MTGNWIEFGIGIFLLIAPWVFAFANVPLARWTDMLCGLVLALANLWAIYGKVPTTGPAIAADAASEPPAAVKVPRRVRRKVESVSL